MNTAFKNLSLAAAIALLASACNQKVETATSVSAPSREIPREVDSSKIFSYDSLRIQDSMKITKTVTAAFDKKVLVFKGLQKPVLDSLYSGVLVVEKPTEHDYTKSGVRNLVTTEMQSYFADTKTNTEDYNPDYKQTWDMVSLMDVKDKIADYLIVLYHGYGYTGGAHGYAYENYKVADLKNQKPLQLSDIVDTSKVSWNKLLLKHLGGRTPELFEKEKLSYTENFYFDKDKITFVYGQYEIAPYSSGIIEVHVPFSAIAPALKPEFKRRMGIK